MYSSNPGIHFLALKTKVIIRLSYHKKHNQKRPDQDRLGGEKLPVSLWRHFSDIVVAVPGTGASLIVIAGVFGRISRTATVFRDTGRAL